MTRPARAGVLLAALVIIVSILAYLRDPPWLLGLDSGIRSWAVAADGTRYRWTDGHASFFVPSDAGSIVIPVRTTFATPSDRPVTVTIAIDDRPADRLVLTDEAWHQVRLTLRAATNRRVRRVDIRVDRTRPGNLGVMVGEIRLE